MMTAVGSKRLSDDNMNTILSFLYVTDAAFSALCLLFIKFAIFRGNSKIVFPCAELAHKVRQQTY